MYAVSEIGAVRRLRAHESRARLQPLVEPLAGFEAVGIVVADEPMRRVEDGLPAAEVVDQHDARRLGVSLTEPENVAQRGAAEAVDALVVVPHDGDVVVRLGDEPHELPLRMVGVLELVDADVPIPPTDALEHGGVVPQETQGEAHLVAEVDAVRRPHEPLVGVVRRGQLGLVGRALGQGRVAGSGGSLLGQASGAGEVRIGADVLVAQAAEQGHQRAQEARRVSQRAVSVEWQLEEMLAQEDDLLRARQDGRAVRQAGLQRVVPQNPVPEGVEGPDLGVVVAVGHQPVDPLDHLVSGTVGERQRQDLGRPRQLLGDQPGDAARDDRGLAGPRAGDDQQRPIAVSHRLPLTRGEVGEERRLDAEVGATRLRRGVRLRGQLREEGELVGRRDDR